MIRIICDTCGVVKNPRQQEWILGYDLRVDTPQTVSRSISFFDRWDDSRILQRGAIHFCSLECKQAYIAENSMNKKMSRRKIQHKRRKAA
jgi:hypothetical protein